MGARMLIGEGVCSYVVYMSFLCMYRSFEVSCY